MMPLRPPGAQFLRPGGPGWQRLSVNLLSPRGYTPQNPTQTPKTANKLQNYETQKLKKLKALKH
ncbi:hypothetical protein T492DRAFT_1093117 [Pavlovales sp. CCMP2436]|nr:hypothetical protein T492DRAFT_1093117 [Pavlovales sp. CCMP2436]